MGKIMNTAIKSKRRDFTEGPIFSQLIFYAIPIILTALLQYCYGMADNIVVGKFSGDEFALAAVGATAELTRLMTNLLMGVGAGAGIIVAQAFGAGDKDKLSKAVHTSVTFSVSAGILFAFIFYFAAEPALNLMGINPVFIDRSILYVRITAFGVPASAIANYSASIFRSVGDSKTPLVILSFSGIVNVILNLIFVVFFSMTVDGVALATVISQYLSALLLIWELVKRKGCEYAFSFKNAGINPKILKRSLLLGIPQAIQSSALNLANVLLVSTMNTFDGYTFTAYTINCQMQSLPDCIAVGFVVACATFTAQNYGAGNYLRIRKTLIYSLVQVATFSFIIGIVIVIFNEPIAMLFMPNDSTGAEAVLYTVKKMNMIVLTSYFIVGMLQTLSSALRGLGCSILQMILHVSGIFVTRFVWIFFVFPKIGTPTGLLLCYPVSWIITLALLGTARFIVGKRLRRNQDGNAVKI